MIIIKLINKDDHDEYNHFYKIRTKLNITYYSLKFIVVLLNARSTACKLG